MDIAALSTALANNRAAVSVSTALTKNAMDIAEQQMSGIVNMMQSASTPSFGHKLDMRV